MALDAVYSGVRTADLVAGQKLKDLFTEEEDLLNNKVPKDKRWAVTVKIEITEYNA